MIEGHWPPWSIKIGDPWSSGKLVTLQFIMGLTIPGTPREAPEVYFAFAGCVIRENRVIK